LCLQLFVPAAAEGVCGKIFVRSRRRSCTAEFSGFLLYKELNACEEESTREVAEEFTLSSRDGLPLGFLNRRWVTLVCPLDLGFLTNRRYVLPSRSSSCATYLGEAYRLLALHLNLRHSAAQQPALPLPLL
jgi:magnesium-protoporphyrin IX monomethyl ester (oxidative) cyclase